MLLMFTQVHCDWYQEKKTAQEPWRWEEVKERGGVGGCSECFSKVSHKQTQDPLRIWS